MSGPRRALAPFALLQHMDARAQAQPTQSRTAAGMAGFDALLLPHAERNLALPGRGVREVMLPSVVRRVPGAPHWWLGLTSLRGRIYPLVDLLALCGVASPATAPLRRWLRVGDESSQQWILAVAQCQRLSVEVAPDFLRQDQDGPAFIESYFMHAGQAWHWVDLPQLLRREDSEFVRG